MLKILLLVSKIRDNTGRMSAFEAVTKIADQSGVNFSILRDNLPGSWK
jgi:kynureninase